MSGWLLGAWMSLWSWCYPEAAPALQEWRSDPRPRGLGWAIALPVLARAQWQAERARPTEGAVRPGRAVGQLREAILFTVAVGVLLEGAIVALSLLATGTFVFEATPVPGLREVPSPYFWAALTVEAITSLLLALQFVALRVVSRRERES